MKDLIGSIQGEIALKLGNTFNLEEKTLSKLAAASAIAVASIAVSAGDANAQMDRAAAQSIANGLENAGWQAGYSASSDGSVGSEIGRATGTGVAAVANKAMGQDVNGTHIGQIIGGAVGAALGYTATKDRSYGYRAAASAIGAGAGIAAGTVIGNKIDPPVQQVQLNQQKAKDVRLSPAPQNVQLNQGRVQDIRFNPQVQDIRFNPQVKSINIINTSGVQKKIGDAPATSAQQKIGSGGQKSMSMDDYARMKNGQANQPSVQPRSMSMDDYVRMKNGQTQDSVSQVKGAQVPQTKIGGNVQQYGSNTATTSLERLKIRGAVGDAMGSSGLPVIASGTTPTYGLQTKIIEQGANDLILAANRYRFNSNQWESEFNKTGGMINQELSKNLINDARNLQVRAALYLDVRNGLAGLGHDVSKFDEKISNEVGNINIIDVKTKIDQSRTVSQQLNH